MVGHINGAYFRWTVSQKISPDEYVFSSLLKSQGLHLSNKTKYEVASRFISEKMMFDARLLYMYSLWDLISWCGIFRFVENIHAPVAGN